MSELCTLSNGPGLTVGSPPALAHTNTLQEQNSAGVGASGLAGGLQVAAQR